MDRLTRHLPLAGAVASWLIVGLCAGLPLAWLALELLTRADVWHVAAPDAFRWRLIGRTFALDAMAASLATLVAIPVALAVAGRGTRPLRGLLPVPLLLPSLVITYGWSQLLALSGQQPVPQSGLDVARCVVALASWLWPAPAMLVAFALSRLDANVLMQARLDGATMRIVARLIAGPAVLGFALAMLLALQEFAIFEPTGISVIATEVRAVFETGASLDGSWSVAEQLAATHENVRSQPARSAAALAVMLPVLAMTAALLAVAWRLGRSLESESGEAGHDAPTVAPVAARLFGVVVALAAVGVPIGAMLASMRTSLDPVRVAREYWPQLVGSSSLALASAGVGAALAVFASMRRPSRWLVALALAGFLVGGQWAAIALIHVFNRPLLVEVYDSPLMAIVAYACRFGWIPIVAGAMTWSPRVRWLRDLAATDGAGAWATWRYVVAPTMGPLLAGAAVLVFTLSLTEVPATTLLQPAETLVPMLMNWAHSLNYDPMIEASLLLAFTVLAFGTVAAMLVRSVMTKLQ